MPNIDRREALRRVASLMGGVVSAPTVAAVLAGCGERDRTAAQAPFRPRTLTAAQHEMVTIISEIILPETDTPGARSARVNEFIDTMLTDYYAADRRDPFLAGLERVEERAQQRHQRRFVALAPEEQTALVAELDRLAFAEGPPDGTTPAGDVGRDSFFRLMKELTLTGYYTSEAGATRELRVNPMGTFRSDIPYSEIGRSWA